MVEKKLEKELLLKKSFKLGFEVGYFHHFEGAGWVAEEKFELEEIGKKLKIEEMASLEYERGKREGVKKRARDDANIGKKEPGKKKERLEKFSIFKDVLNTPSFLEKPGMLTVLKRLKTPGIVRLFRFR